MCKFWVEKVLGVLKVLRVIGWFLLRNRWVNYFRKWVNLFRDQVNYFRGQYSNTSYYWRSCLPCTALPFSHTAAYPRGVRHSMYCAQSSKWGLFGRNTRSAIRGTSSLKKSAFSGKSTRISFGSNKQRKASAKADVANEERSMVWQTKHA